MKTKQLFARSLKSVTLNGTTWVTVFTLLHSIKLEELFMKVPTLASAATVALGIFDSGFLTDGEERWNSGAKAENAVYDILIERIIPSGGMLKIKADAAATEDVEIVLYDSE